MPDSDPDAPAHEPAWRPLPRSRPWYKKLSAHRLAEAQVRSPRGSIYLVRVVSDSPVAGLSKAANLPADPLGNSAEFLMSTLRGSNGGWTIEVLKPSSRWRSERVLYTRPVGAAAIVVDIAIAITGAITRGDKLWSEDDDY